MQFYRDTNRIFVWTFPKDQKPTPVLDKEHKTINAAKRDSKARQIAGEKFTRNPKVPS